MTRAQLAAYARGLDDLFAPPDARPRAWRCPCGALTRRESGLCGTVCEEAFGGRATCFDCGRPDAECQCARDAEINAQERRDDDCAD